MIRKIRAHDISRKAHDLNSNTPSILLKNLLHERCHL